MNMLVGLKISLSVVSALGRIEWQIFTYFFPQKSQYLGSIRLLTRLKEKSYFSKSLHF